MPINSNNFSFSTFLSADFGNSIGSGFRLIHKKKEYIITAKHVIFQNGKMMSDLWIKSRNYNGAESDMFNAEVKLTEYNVTLFDELDIALIRLQKRYKYKVISPGNNISSATIKDVVTYNHVKIASNILLIGFPSSLTTDQFYDVDRPLLRMGIVAGKNVNDATFVIDSIAYYGVSGGPVVQIDENQNIHIIGVVSRYVPFITEWRNKHESSLSRQDFYNSGYAVCIPMDKVLNSIKK